MEEVIKLPYAKLNSVIPIEVSFESMISKIEGNYISAKKIDNFTYEVHLKVKEVVVISATTRSGQVITKKYIPTW